MGAADSVSAEGKPPSAQTVPYKSIALEHLRHLEDIKMPASDIAVEIQWVLAAEDAVRSAAYGHSLRL